MRIVGVIRLSMATEESTSVERQMEAIQAWADKRGHTIVGWTVEDVDVSGAVSPWDRPGFSKWLADVPPMPFDGFCAWKLDRYSRSLLNFAELMAWSAGSGKSLATSDDQLDTATPGGRAMAGMMATFAEFEREMISARAQSSQVKLRKVGRWHGGQIPFGTRKVKTAEGARLVVDPEAAGHRVDMAEMRIGGASLHKIAQHFNGMGVYSPRGNRWTPAAVRAVLRSPAFIGQREHKGKVIRGDDGMPVQFHDPMISLAKWQELQAVLDAAHKPRSTVRDQYMLRGLMFCGTCGHAVYRDASKSRGRTYHYFRCGNNECTERVNFRADAVETHAVAAFMETMGAEPVTEHVFIPGEDHTHELEQVRRAITGLREESDAGLYEDDRAGYLSRLKGLTERRRELEKLPNRPDAWEDRPTGQTYAEEWETATLERRNGLLTGINLRAVLYLDQDAALSAADAEGTGTRRAMLVPVARDRFMVASWDVR